MKHEFKVKIGPFWVSEAFYELILFLGWVAASLAFTFLLFWGSGAWAGNVYVCDVDGAKVYTDTPCHADAEPALVVKPDPVVVQASPAVGHLRPTVQERQAAVNDRKAMRRSIDRQYKPMVADVDKQIAQTEKEIRNAGAASNYFGGNVRRSNAAVIAGLQAKLGSLRQERAAIVLAWRDAANEAARLDALRSAVVDQ